MRANIARLPIAGLLGAVVLAALLAGCGRGGPGDGPQPEDLSPAGPKRSFAMGFSALPGENTPSGYRRAFELAGRYGELVLVQRTAPWDEFVSGSMDVSPQLRDTTKLERGLAEQYRAEFVLAVDPTDAKDRHRLAPLPEALRGKNFGNEEVRRSYLTYVRYMAANYRPKYMALAVDVNLLAGGNPTEFDRFLPVYLQAYDLVKEVSPRTKVFATFQYEDLLGRLPWNKHDPDWDLLKRFGEKLDVVAISTYPSLLDRPIQDLPDDYYVELRQHTDKPVAIIDMGYSSGPGANGVNAGSEAEQLRFLQRAMEAADRLQMEFIIWFAAIDPSYVLEPPLDAYASVGLHAPDGKAKAAWQIWIQNFRRPYGERAPGAPIDVPKRRNPIATAPPEERGQPRPDDRRNPFNNPPASPAGPSTPVGPSPAPPSSTPTPIS